MSLDRVDVAFVEEAETSRVESLERLREALGRAEDADIDRDSFHLLFVAAVRVLELDQDTVAGIVKASRPTVSRWLSGTAAPHHVGRPSVFRELRKVAAAKIKQHSAAMVACA